MNAVHEVLPAALYRRAREAPARIFIQEADGRAFSYGQALERVQDTAGRLRALGVSPGDRVAVMLPIGADAVFAWLGTAWLRAMEVPLNTDYRYAMLEHALQVAAPRIIVTSSEFAGRFAEVPLPPTVEVIAMADSGEPGPAGRAVAHLAQIAPAPVGELTPPQAWDTAAILFTSGTTGPSKGVVIPWGLLTVGAQIFDHPGPDDAMYSPFPLYHGSGKGAVTNAALGGGRVILRERFSVHRFWADIDRYHATHTVMLPQVARWLLARPPEPGDRRHALRYVLMGPVIRGFTERFGVRAATHFGMTELGACLYRPDIDDGDPRPHLGRPIHGYEARVVDEHDQPVPDGQPGELIVRSAAPWTLASGYFGQPEASLQAMRNGWFHTGDQFRRDPDGTFTFVDRIKDAIRRRGENISSFEVEAAVLRHQGVAECAAVAVRDSDGDEEVKIVVVRAADGPLLSHEEVLRHCIETLPRFMVPRYIEFAAELPKTTATLRVQKAVLRAAGLTEATWDRTTAGIEAPR